MVNQPGNCQVIVDSQAHPGSWNMAVDEVLLESSIQEQQTFFRWYQWSEATLSLGYFQNRSAIEDLGHLKHLPKVRRLSGGGAIVHHHELTYSCVIPKTHPLSRTPAQLYEQIHQQVIQSLSKYDIELHFRNQTSSAKTHSFLCFSRSDRYDLVVDHHKVLGSAQRRRRGSILQHGGLLLQRSTFAPEFPGLFDLFPQKLNHVSPQQLTTHLIEDISQCLQLPTQKTELNEYQRSLAQTLQSNRYSSIS